MRRTGPKYKVSETQQKKITRDYLTRDISQQELADKYQVSTTAIRNYVKRYKEEIEEEITT